jgi:hypothetical protein
LHNKSSSKSAEKHPNESSSSGNDNEKGSKKSKEDNKTNLLTQKIKKNNINLHRKPTSQHSENRHIPKTPVNTHKNSKKLSKSNEKLKNRNSSEKFSAKEQLKQSSPSRDDNEKSNKEEK